MEPVADSTLSLMLTSGGGFVFHCEWRFGSGFLLRRQEANLNPNVIVEAALRHGGIISRFEMVEPPLTDIFIELVGATALPDTPSVLSA